MDGFLEVWWISSFAYFLYAKIGLVHHPIDWNNHFLHGCFWMFLGDSRWFPWIDVFFEISTTKRYVRENGREITFLDLRDLFLEWNPVMHQPPKTRKKSDEDFSPFQIGGKSPQPFITRIFNSPKVPAICLKKRRLEPFMGNFWSPIVRCENEGDFRWCDKNQPAF